MCCRFCSFLPPKVSLKNLNVVLTALRQQSFFCWLDFGCWVALSKFKLFDQHNGGLLAAQFRSVGSVAGLDPSARTNELGNLEIMIGFPGQVPRGGIVYIDGEPSPPETPLGRVLIRSLGDNWYEFILARNEG